MKTFAVTFYDITNKYGVVITGTVFPAFQYTSCICQKAVLFGTDRTMVMMSKQGYKLAFLTKIVFFNLTIMLAMA